MPLLFEIIVYVLPSVITQEKETKCIQIGKEEIKLLMFTDDMIIYVENLRGSTKKFLELINESSKVKGYLLSTQKNSCIYIHNKYINENQKF